MTWQGNGQTEASQDVVRGPAGGRPRRAATALVGGTTAQTVDLIDSIRRHLPWMALIVVAVMLVLLFVAFGSVVLPLKAIVMNALSITRVVRGRHLDLPGGPPGGPARLHARPATST